MACGHSGNACTACGPGQTCSAGVCVPTPNPNCIVIAPADLEFGTVQTGCRSAVTSVRLQNICNLQVTISALGVAGSGFTTSGLAIPSTIPANGSASFDLTFAPTAVGRVDTTLVVGATHSASTFAYQTTVGGTGATTGLNQDRFTIPTKTDVVLIVDDSCSMSEEQAALGSNANAFLAYAFSSNVDFALGVTTTDMDSTNGQGRFQGPQGLRVLRNTTPNLLQTFNTRVAVGTNGSGTEQMFAPAVASLSTALLTTTNVGFLRNDAALAVLAFTDAEEQSPLVTQTYLAQLLAVKGQRKRNQFSFSFVGPTRPNPVSPCFYDGNAPDPRQIAMVEATGGTSSEICNVDNSLAWRTEATRVGQAVFGARAVWFLTARPATGTIGLTVFQNGVPVPEMTGGQRNWSYDGARNAVVFSSNSLPGPGQNVGFDYTVACMPGGGGGTDAGVTGCGPITCAGCCDPTGVCQAGTTNAACGVLGNACRACTFVCANGACL